MKKITVVAFLLTAGTLLFAQDAASIVRSSRDRIEAKSISSSAKMTIVPTRGQKQEREFVQYSKDGPNGSRIVLDIRRPARVADTRFLSVANEDASKPNDQWVCLPGNNPRARRIEGAGSGQSFVNSDFSYDDLSSGDRNADKDTHALLREETLNGKACYVIESVPKDSSYQYGKMVLWIDKANYVTYKIELFDKRGTQVKLYEILELREVQGRLSPWVMKMTTLRNNNSTTIELAELQYDVEVPDGIFTTSFLETGKY
jgi:outer membrane lipoprotein-sorting protein